jgi:hypothetical protein
MNIIQIQIPRWHWFVASFFITGTIMAGLGFLFFMIAPNHPSLQSSGDLFALLTWLLILVAPILWTTLRQPFSAPWGKERVYIVSFQALSAWNGTRLEFKLSKHPSDEWQKLFKAHWLRGDFESFGRKKFICACDDLMVGLAAVKAAVEQTNAGIDQQVTQAGAERLQKAKEEAASIEAARARLKKAAQDMEIRLE